jgi:hypothetical protein
MLILAAFALAINACGGNAADPMATDAGTAAYDSTSSVPAPPDAMAEATAPVVDRSLSGKGKGKGKGGPRARFNGFGEAQGGTSGMGNYADGSYDYIIDREHPFTPHAYDDFHVKGVVTSADFEHRSAYMTVGLVVKEFADAVLDGWDWPSYMFNQHAFMLCYERDGVLNIHPSDYNGSPYGDALFTVEPKGNGKYYFRFDVKFVPSGPATPGGMMYLSINGSEYSEGVPYGYDNWEKAWGWNRLIEFNGTQAYGFDMSETCLVGQFYTENPDAYVSAHINARVK